MPFRLPFRIDLQGQATVDDVAAAASMARRRRERRTLVVVALAVLFLAVRDLLNLSSGRSIAFGAPHIPSSIVPYLPAIALVALLALVTLGPMVGLGRSPHALVKAEDVEFSMTDILGSPSTTTMLRELIHEYRNFARLESGYGGKPPRAVLFEGPPGTGKTMAAKVLAKEAGVPFLFVSASSFQSMYYGQTNRKLRSFFRHLRRLTRRYGGAVGFIEEFDSIAASRSGMASSGTREGVTGVVAELLVQLQSFDVAEGMWRFLPGRLSSRPSKNRTVRGVAPRYLLLAATNRASDLDPAVVRPGRFDKVVNFGLPPKQARLAILEGLLTSRPCDVEALRSFGDLELAASMTGGLSQAGLNRLVEEASTIAWRRGSSMIERTDLLDALSRRSLGVDEGTPYTVENKLRIAVHEAGHAALAWYLGTSNTVVGVVSILKRGDALGLTASYSQEDLYMHTRSELERRLSMMVGGMAAERFFLKEASTGASSDLAAASDLALAMVVEYGMGRSLASIGNLQPQFSASALLNDGSVRSEVTAVLEQARSRATSVIDGHADVIWKMVVNLLEREELYESDLRELLGERPSQAVDLRIYEGGRHGSVEASW